jgi:chromosome segregation ATPase
MATNILRTIMAKLTGGLDSLKDKQSRLTSQRDAAKTSLEKARAALQLHLLEGDDGDAKAVAALQAKVDSASSLLASLNDAIAEQARRVADAEQALVDEQQAAARKAASEALAADVDAIEGKLAPWLAATRELAGLVEAKGTRPARLRDFSPTPPMKLKLRWP